MGSFHDSMAAHFGAPMLFEHFAERDANGDKEPIEYQAPDKSDFVKIERAIVGRLVVGDQNDGGQATQTDEIREAVEVQVEPANELAVGGLVRIKRYEGEAFYVESTTRTGAMVSHQAARYSATQKARRGFQRGRT